MTRIEPLQSPFVPEVRAHLASMMPPGIEPIALFRTFAKNMPMARAMQPWGTYELGRQLSVTLRDREIVIDRTCARCGCEYEWGVHVAFFSERAGLDERQVTSLTHGGPGDACWDSARDQVLLSLVDSLHDDSFISGGLWRSLCEHFDEVQILDLTMLCGWYHAISFTARSSGVPLEDGAPRFAAFELVQSGS
jgi:alkylhydroperoxidase family enzyme